MSRESKGKQKVPLPQQENKLQRGDKLLTAGQYLECKECLDKAVQGLIKSFGRAKVMTFQDWERETSALLNKKIW